MFLYNLNFHFLNFLFDVYLHILAPINKPLYPNSYYALFIRVYVTDDLHTSSGWYPIVLTFKEDDRAKQGGRISKSRFSESMAV